MQLDKIQNTSPKIPELIMQSLIGAIEAGHIHVGEELPSERELAESLGVGRGSLRECLAILEFLGAIESRGNRKVLLRNADFIQKVRTWIESANQMDTRRTFNEFRQVIEVGIVKLACERATDEDIAAMAHAANCGAALLATMHAAGLDELRQKPLWPLLRDSGVFRRAVVIEGMGEERRYRVEELLP